MTDRISLPRLAATLRLAPLLALLTGCGGGDTGDTSTGDAGDGTGQVTIRYMRWADPTELEATREALAAFEASHPDIHVKLEYTAWSQYYSKLQTLMAGREAPDVFALSGAFFHDLRSRGVLADLTARVDADPVVDLLDFYQAPVSVFRHEDRIYGIPRDFNVVALFYNKDLFDAANVPYPDSSWTWRELRDAAQRLTRDTNADGSPDQWGLQISNDMEVGWGSYVYQNGGSVLDASRRRFAMAEPAAVEALEFLRSLLYDDHVSPSPLDTESLSGTPFRNGRIAMITTGSWTLGTLDATEGFRYGVAPLPAGKVRATVANGVAHAISSTTEHADVAWALVEFFSSPEGQRILARSGTSIPARRDVAESPAFLDAGRDDVDRGVFLRSMAYARTLPFTPAIARWGGEVLKALDRVWLGELTPRAAMTEVAPKVDALLARAYAEPAEDDR